MPLHLKAAFFDLLFRAIDHVIGNKFVKRQRIRDKWRADATAAWHARLPAARSSDDPCAVTNTGLDVSPQLTSPFFRKLPLEIRRLIYSELFVGNELLFQVVNEVKDGTNADERGNAKIPFELRCRAVRGLLSFPISCKLAYAESFNYLYTSNTFRLAGITEYWCLTRLLSRQYLDLIQDLHIQYAYTGTGYDRDLTLGTPPYNLHCWNETWDDISRLKSIARVRIDMHRYEGRILDLDEEFYFSSLDNLRRRVELEVYVSWRPPPGAVTWPFMVRRGMSFHKDNDGNFSLFDQ